MRPPIHIMILNWNGSDLTLDCLDSLSRVRYENMVVSVIDNGSTDDSVSAILEKFPAVDIIQLDQNYGFAGGYNRAIRQAKLNPEEYLLLLNNDTTVHPAILDELIRGVHRHGSSNIFGAKIFYADRPDTIWYAGGNVSFSGLRINHRGIRRRDSAEYSEDIRTDYITGCCLMISSGLFTALGGFDEQFSMYAEDVDLCLRARSQHALCYMIPQAQLWHKVSSSVGGNLSFTKNSRKLKSRWMLIRKRRLKNRR